MQIEKLVDMAIDYRIATLKAIDSQIIGISYVGTENEEFQFYDEAEFAKLIKDKAYTVKRFDSTRYKYRYSSVISGLRFICLSDDFLFPGDENKLEGEVA